MPVHLPDLPIVEKLSPRVIRVLGGNPSIFTLQGSPKASAKACTNTYIIGTGDRRILVDTGEGKPIWIESVRDILKREDATISQVIITHRHNDHVGGIKQLLEFAPDVTIYKHQAENGQLEIFEGQRFHVSGASLTAILTPGHTRDHVALVLEEEDAIFTGDNVLGHGTVVYEDLLDYLLSLEKLQNICRGRIYPGHGPVIWDGPSRIKEYIQHRKERENQVILVLLCGKLSPDAETEGKIVLQDWTPMEIVKIMYNNISEDLHLSAQHGVLEILKKLKVEERVIEINEIYNTSRWRLKT